jgi:hypothetical protein
MSDLPNEQTMPQIPAEKAPVPELDPMVIPLPPAKPVIPAPEGHSGEVGP